MHLLLQRHIFTGFSVAEEFDGQNDHTQQENKKTDAVDTMHVTDPFFFGPVRVFFPDKKILGQLFQNSHIR